MFKVTHLAGFSSLGAFALSLDLYVLHFLLGRLLLLAIELRYLYLPSACLRYWKSLLQAAPAQITRQL